MTYGITPQGFVGKPATQSKSDFDAAFKGIFGQSVGSEPDGSIPAASSIGQEIALLVDSESSAWEVMQAVYAGFDPDQAVTPQLQILCALTGTRQKEAIASTSLVTCFGVIGTVLPVGRVVSVVDLNTRFDSLAQATLAAVSTAWATSTSYSVGDLVTANGKIWQCTVAGVSAGAGAGPTGAQFTYQADGTVTWVCVCATGLGVAIVEYQAEETGPLAADALALSQIQTPVDGWQGAFNAAAANVGRNLETEPALRARRQVELQASGGGPPDAIRAALLARDDVEDCRVFVNNTNAVDADGVPAHGVEVLILAPTVPDDADGNAVLALAVWKAVGAGTATGGNRSATITDASGNPQTVYFSRPTPVNIYLVVTTYYDPTKWTGANPDAAVEAATVSALMNFALGYYGIGVSVRMVPLAASVEDGPQATLIVAGTPEPLYPGSVYGDLPAGSQPMPGVVDVLLYLGTAPAPATQATIAIGKRQIAAFDPTRISVTATTETP